MKAVNRARRGNYTYTAPEIRDRTVRSTTVPCPTCGAPAGERCAASTPHRPRRRLAIRQLNQASTDVPDFDWLRTVPAHRRRDLRRDAGFTTAAALAATLGVDAVTLRRWERAETLPRGAEGCAYVDWLKERAA